MLQRTRSVNPISLTILYWAGLGEALRSWKPRNAGFNFMIRCSIRIFNLYISHSVEHISFAVRFFD